MDYWRMTDCFNLYLNVRLLLNFHRFYVPVFPNKDSLVLHIASECLRRAAGDGGGKREDFCMLGQPKEDLFIFPRILGQFYSSRGTLYLLNLALHMTLLQCASTQTHHIWTQLNPQVPP